MKHREAYQAKIQQETLSYIKVYGPISSKKLSEMMLLTMAQIKLRIKGLLFNDFLENIIFFKLPNVIISGKKSFDGFILKCTLFAVQ